MPELLDENGFLPLRAAEVAFPLARKYRKGQRATWIQTGRWRTGTFRWAAWAMLAPVAATAGCGMTPLDDAQFRATMLATAEDEARYDRALEISRREGFGGASVPGPDGAEVTFGPGDYDAFQKYERESLRLRSAGTSRFPPYWPLVRVVFSSDRNLRRAPSSSGALYWCDAGTPFQEDGFTGQAEILWRDRFIDDHPSSELRAALDTPSSPQEYEFLFPYTSILEQRPLPRGTRTVTQAPPKGDLCFALVQYTMLMPPSVGRPLRIDKEALTAALGPLPRSVTITR